MVTVVLASLTGLAASRYAHAEVPGAPSGTGGTQCAAGAAGSEKGTVRVDVRDRAGRVISRAVRIDGKVRGRTAAALALEPCDGGVEVSVEGFRGAVRVPVRAGETVLLRGSDNVLCLAGHDWAASACRCNAPNVDWSSARAAAFASAVPNPVAEGSFASRVSTASYRAAIEAWREGRAAWSGGHGAGVERFVEREGFCVVAGKAASARDVRGFGAAAGAASASLVASLDALAWASLAHGAEVSLQPGNTRIRASLTKDGAGTSLSVEMRAVSSGDELPFRQEVEVRVRAPGKPDWLVSLATGEVFIGPEATAVRVAEREAPRVFEALRAAVVATGGRLEVVGTQVRQGQARTEVSAGW